MQLYGCILPHGRHIHGARRRDTPDAPRSIAARGGPVPHRAGGAAPHDPTGGDQASGCPGGSGSGGADHAGARTVALPASGAAPGDRNVAGAVRTVLGRSVGEVGAASTFTARRLPGAAGGAGGRSLAEAGGAGGRSLAEAGVAGGRSLAEAGVAGGRSLAEAGVASRQPPDHRIDLRSRPGRADPIRRK